MAESGHALHAHRTVDRVAGILELTARNPDGIGLGTLAEQLDAPKSSVHGLIRGLVAVGYLSEAEHRYRIGPGVAALLRPIQEDTLEQVAHEHLVLLSRETGETVLLGRRIGYSVIYTSQVESSQLVRYSAPLRSRRPLTSTSMGRIFLADFGDRGIRTAAQREAVDEAGLRRELDQVRAHGVALNLEESLPGVVAVASGVRNGDDRLVAAMTVVGPSARLRPAIDEAATAVRATARRLSEKLGQA